MDTSDTSDTSPGIEHQIHEVPENIVSFKGREIDEMADEDKPNNNIDINTEIDEMAEEDNTNNNDVNADDENYSFEQEEGGGDTDLNYSEVSEGLFTFFRTYYLLSLLDKAPNDLVGCIINRENRLFQCRKYLY